MSEDKKSQGASAIATIRKFHPFAFLLLFGLMFLANYTLNSNMPLLEKITLSGLSFCLFWVLTIFEFYRIDKQEESKMRVFEN